MKAGKFELVSKYDIQSDILYLHKTNKYDYKESVEIGDNLILDFDEDNDPVALEILDASKFFNVKKFSIQHIEDLNLKIIVNENIIGINGIFTFPVHNKGMSRSFIEETVNDINMPYMETSFGMAEA